MSKAVGADSKREKYLRALFADPDVPGVQLTVREAAELKMYRAIFVFICSNPWETDTNLVNWIRQYYKDDTGELCSKAVAMSDLSFVKSLLGNVKIPAKQFMMYQVSQMQLTQYNNQNATITERINAAKELGKIYKLDKPDEDAIPWDQLLSKIEITLKPEDVGLPQIDNVRELQDRLYHKYVEPFATDAVVIETKTNKTE